jgi:hypothetical protein
MASEIRSVVNEPLETTLKPRQAFNNLIIEDLNGDEAESAQPATAPSGDGFLPP